MSESNEHRKLVCEIAEEVDLRYPNMRVKKDIINRPGDISTPSINDYKPDVYATNLKRKFFIIGEAKTDIDLDISHTYSQLRAFTSYLEMKEHGIFILGTFGSKSDRAKTILYYLRQEMSLKSTILQVYDGFDYWELGGPQGTKWLLI